MGEARNQGHARSCAMRFTKEDNEKHFADYKAFAAGGLDLSDIFGDELDEEMLGNAASQSPVAAPQSPRMASASLGVAMAKEYAAAHQHRFAQPAAYQHRFAQPTAYQHRFAQHLNGERALSRVSAQQRWSTVRRSVRPVTHAD